MSARRRCSIAFDNSIFMNRRYFLGATSSVLLGTTLLSSRLWAAPSMVALPIKRWTAFHFRFVGRQDPAAMLREFVVPEAVPQTLSFRGQEARAVVLEADGNDGGELDLFPLTVPDGFVSGNNLAVLMTTLEAPQAMTVRVATSADWYVAWFCNGQLCFSTFNQKGNVIFPPGPLDHDFELPLRAGRNRITVLVLAGAAGFKLFHAIAPPDLDAHRQALAAAAARHAAAMRAQLGGEARVQVQCAQLAPLPDFTRPEHYLSFPLGRIEPGTLETWTRTVGRPRFVRAFGCISRDTLRYGTSGATHERRIAQLRAVSAFCDQIMTPLPDDGVTDLLDGNLSEARYEDRMVMALQEMRAVAPNARWIEVFNESEVGQRALSDIEYYRCYRIAYRALHRLNARDPQGAPLLLGAPSPSFFNRPRIRAFLDNYAADTDARKRLDFLAYHQYLFGKEARPRLVSDELATLQGWLRDAKLDPDLPIHVTESGIFPVNNGTKNYAADLLTQAAGVLSLHFWYLQQGTNIFPYQWTWLHLNPRKNVWVPATRRLDTWAVSAKGPDKAINAAIRPFTTDSPTRLTPFGNAYRLLGRLKSQRLEATATPQNDEGLGLYALATRDQSGVAVLVWNYAWTDYQDAPRREVTLELNDLGAALPTGQCRVRRFLIDETHSHYMSDGDELRCIEERVMEREQATTQRFALERNAITLLEWETVVP